MTPRIAPLLPTLALTLSGAAAAQCFEQALQPAGIGSSDRFGAALAADGDRLFAGAPGPPEGTVVRYRRDASGVWQQEQTLTPTGSAVAGAFGEALALGHDVLIVGAPHTSGVGAVYVFEEGRPGGVWKQRQALHAALPCAKFGAAVALDGEVLVVGAPFETVGLAHLRGAAYVYRRQPASELWQLEQRIPWPGAGAFMQFGTQVAVAGDFLAVSAPFTGIPAVGEVHVYHWDAASEEWTPHTVLAPGLRAFGQALAMEGEWLLVGMKEALPPTGPWGRVRVYRYDAGTDAWNLEHEELGPDRGYVYSFAEGLALSAGLVVVSASSGPLAFLYELDGAGALHLVAPLAWTASVTYRYTWRAPSVALAGATVALGNEQFFSDRGRVETFGRDRCEPLGRRFCTPALPNSTGHRARIDALGDARLAAELFSLRALLVPTDEVGYFLAAREPGSVPYPGSSGGVVCLSGPILRFRSQFTYSSHTGFFAHALNLASLPTIPPSAVLPGETWYFQGWFRDGASSNFTDGVAVTFL